ncbi:hypothetical protein X975_19025, partial [Stegodyphus mimosarum]
MSVVTDDSAVLYSQQSQTLAQITTQQNQGDSHIVSKWIVQCLLHHTGFRSHRPMRVPLLNACHRTVLLAWTREHRL